MTFLYNLYTASVVVRGQSLISLPKESLKMTQTVEFPFIPEGFLKRTQSKCTLTSVPIKLAATIHILHSCSGQKDPLNINRKAKRAF